MITMKGACSFIAPYMRTPDCGQVSVSSTDRPALCSVGRNTEERGEER